MPLPALMGLFMDKCPKFQYGPKSAIGDLTGLIGLELSSNTGLIGPIPREIQQCTKLLTLSIQRCSLNGPLPSELGNLALLSYFTATSVEIELPVSSDATTLAVRTSSGSAVYALEREALLWKIKSFPGGKIINRRGLQEYMLRAKFGLPSCGRNGCGKEATNPCENLKFPISQCLEFR